MHQGGETIGALVLVAGLSRRMGDFKPLLPLRGRTLIENSVESALNGGAETVTVVTGYHADEVETLLRRSFSDRVCFVRNTDYASTDMMHSIQIGAAALPACDAFFLLPGDMPFVSPSTYEKLLAKRARIKAPVIFPTREGYRKHPPLIDAEMIPAILAYSGDSGLRGLWKQYEQDIVTVPVDDDGVWIDIDTPTDYRNCMQNYELHKEE